MRKHCANPSCNNEFEPSKYAPHTRFCCQACKACSRRIMYGVKFNTKRRERNRVDRLAAIQAYGGCCAYCGDTDLDVLEIDHINNDGAKQRKELGASGTPMVAWLKKRNLMGA